MPTATTTDRDPRRVFTLDEELRAVLADELYWLTQTLGDEIQHANADSEEPASVILEREARRLPLARAIAAAVESGRLDAIALMHLDEIAELVRVSALELRDNVERDRDSLQTFIVRDDPGYGFGHYGKDRAGSIAEYHEQIATNRRRLAACERFLAAVDEWQAAAREAAKA